MGRRALPKIDPRLDLSSYWTTFKELPSPFSAHALFGREAPLEVEVGCGKGLFLQNSALEKPHHNFLGIEVSRKYARFTAARLAKRGFDNARVVHGDAMRLFLELLPADSLRAVHVYFPDPWWKARHHKRRVLTEAFLRDVERTLEPEGRLHFWTDVKAYYDATLDLIAHQALLAGPFEVPEQAPEHDLDYHTHFERRTRLLEEPVYRAEFEKRSVT